MDGIFAVGYEARGACPTLLTTEFPKNDTPSAISSIPPSLFNTAPAREPASLAQNVLPVDKLYFVYCEKYFHENTGVAAR